MAAAEATATRGSLAPIYGVVLLTTLFWGGTAVAGKFALRDVPIVTVGVVRYGVAALLLAGLSWPSLRQLSALRAADARLLAVLGLLGACLNHLFFFGGLALAPASHGAIIPPTVSTVWTVFLAARLGREEVTRWQVAGMVFCLAGVVLVMRPERLLAGAGRLALLGDLLFLLCALAWGTYSYVTKVAMRRFSAAATLICAMGIGTLCLAPLAAWERPWVALRTAGPAAWGALGYLTVAATCLSFLGWSIAIRRLGAGRTAVFGILVPVFGVFLSWLVLGERLGPIQILGAAVALCGVLLCQTSGGPRPSPQPPPRPVPPAGVAGASAPPASAAEGSRPGASAAPRTYDR